MLTVNQFIVVLSNWLKKSCFLFSLQCTPIKSEQARVGGSQIKKANHIQCKQNIPENILSVQNKCTEQVCISMQNKLQTPLPLLTIYMLIARTWAMLNKFSVLMHQLATSFGAHLTAHLTLGLTGAKAYIWTFPTSPLKRNSLFAWSAANFEQA